MKRLLIIIDVQHGFINDNTVGVIDKIIAAKNCLHYDKCVFTKYLNCDESNFVRFINWDHLKSTEEQRLVLPVGSDDAVFEKASYSALTDEFVAFLKEGEYDSAYLCGIETDSCVLATAYDLFDFGVKPIILIDCCASAGGEGFHSAAKVIMRRSFGSANVNDLNHYIQEENYNESGTSDH